MVPVSGAGQQAVVDLVALSELEATGLPEPDAAAALEHCSGDADAALLHAVACLDSGGASAVAQADRVQEQRWGVACFRIRNRFGFVRRVCKLKPSCFRNCRMHPRQQHDLIVMGETINKPSARDSKVEALSADPTGLQELSEPTKNDTQSSDCRMDTCGGGRRGGAPLRAQAASYVCLAKLSHLTSCCFRFDAPYPLVSPGLRLPKQRWRRSWQQWTATRRSNSACTPRLARHLSPALACCPCTGYRTGGPRKTVLAVLSMPRAARRSSRPRAVAGGGCRRPRGRPGIASGRRCASCMQETTVPYLMHAEVSCSSPCCPCTFRRLWSRYQQRRRDIAEGAGAQFGSTSSSRQTHWLRFLHGYTAPVARWSRHRSQVSKSEFEPLLLMACRRGGACAGAPALPWFRASNLVHHRACAPIPEQPSDFNICCT